MTPGADPHDGSAKLALRMHELCHWRHVGLGEEQTALGGDVRALFEALERGELVRGACVTMSERRLRALQKRVEALARSAHAGPPRWAGLRATLTGRRTDETEERAERERRIRRDLAELVEQTLTVGG